MKKTFVSSPVNIAMFIGNFNPPGKHHQAIVKKLAEEFDRVIIITRGASNVLRKQQVAMIKLAFDHIPEVVLDFSDLRNNTYTPIYLLEDRYRQKYPEAEIWHAVGSDLIIGGRNQSSKIQRTWVYGSEVWRNLNFCIVSRPNYELVIADLPPKFITLENINYWGSSEVIKERLLSHKKVSLFLSAPVLRYIKHHNLYGS